MNDTLRLIEQLIAEHKVLTEKTEDLVKFANDALIISELKKAMESFVPGRFDQSQGLAKLQEMLALIAAMADKHFHREETVLLAAVEKHGDRKLVTALNSLLLEHTDLRNRYAESKNHITELKSGALPHQRWNESANDMRAHLSHTRRLQETHFVMESELFNELRRHLKAASGREEMIP